MMCLSCIEIEEPYFSKTIAMIKHLIYTLILFFSLFASFAQNRLPVQKGFITIVTGQKMEFINLKFQDDQVKFTNVTTRSEFTYFLNSVKRIEDLNKNIIYQKDSVVKSNDLIENEAANQTSVNENVVVETEKDRLEFRNCSKILRNGVKLTPDEVKEVLKSNSYALKSYTSGRTINTIGTLCISFGAGLIVGGGYSNITIANNENSTKKGSPAPIIAGLIVGAISIPLKISGREKVRRAIANYNRSLVAETSKTNYEFYAKVDGNGVGLTLKW